MKKKRMLLLVLTLIFAGTFVTPAEGGGEKELTLLVYLSGTDLEAEYGAATNDFNEMLEAELYDEEINVVVLAGGSKSWNTPGLLENKKNTLKITDDEMKVIQRDPLTNMGEEKTLEDFVRYGISRYPAKQYGLIFWDHGGGAVDGVCLDSWYEDCLTMDEIDRALKAGLDGKKLSFVGFDACLMSTVEVARTLSPYASYMVASEELEPGNGWDYGFLSELKDVRSIDAGFIVNEIADYYYDSYPKTESKTMAVLDLEKMDEFSKVLNTYFAELKTKLKEKDAVSRFTKLRAALFEFGFINSYYTSSNMVDLAEFVEKSGEYFDLETERVLDALSNVIIKNLSNIEEAGGLSVFYPYRGKNRIPSLLYQYETLSPYPEYVGFLNSFYGAVNDKAASALEDRLSSVRKETMEIVVNTGLMNQIEKVYRMQWRKWGTEGSRYLRIGSLEGIGYREDGTLTPEFDGQWFTWQGRLLPIEAYGNQYGRYSFPALVNGGKMRILIETGPDGIPFRISGATPENDSGLPAKAVVPIQEGDLIQIAYEINVFEEEGKADPAAEYDKSDGSTYYGKVFCVKNRKIAYGDVPSGTYLYGYGFLDYAQNLYLSDFIRAKAE